MLRSLLVCSLHAAPRACSESISPAFETESVESESVEAAADKTRFE